jgi:hypothetical protein
MKQDYTNNTSKYMGAAFLIILLWSVPQMAQEKSAATAQDSAKSITGKVISIDAAILANTQVIVETACDCEPCKKKGVSCSICCPPGYVPQELGTATADQSGAFKIELPPNTPSGLYSLKVMSGRFSRAVIFEIDEKDTKLEFKIPKQSDIKVDTRDTVTGLIEAEVKIPLNTRMG